MYNLYIVHILLYTLYLDVYIYICIYIIQLKHMMYTFIFDIYFIYILKHFVVQ